MCLQSFAFRQNNHEEELTREKVITSIMDIVDIARVK